MRWLNDNKFTSLMVFLGLVVTSVVGPILTYQFTKTPNIAGAGECAVAVRDVRDALDGVGELTEALNALESEHSRFVNEIRSIQEAGEGQLNDHIVTISGMQEMRPKADTIGHIRGAILRLKMKTDFYTKNSTNRGEILSKANTGGQVTNNALSRMSKHCL